MSWAVEVEGRMVTGETAFMAACLFALESRRQINRLSERLDEVEQIIREMQELVTEHEAEIGTLNTQVWSLEDMSEPVLTQLRLTPDNSDPVPTRYVPPRSCSPSSSFPTSYPSPLYPTSDYAPFEGTPVPFRIFSFVLVPPRTMSSLSPLRTPYVFPSIT